MDEEEESATAQQSDRRGDGGFGADLLPPTAHPSLPPPPRCSSSPARNRLKGMEILRKLEGKWWTRVLKQATDATVKDAGRIANYRVFYEADDELLSQSLYRNTYAKGATAREGSWMVVASKGSGGAQMLALEGPAPEPLALMPPQGCCVGGGTKRAREGVERATRATRAQLSVIYSGLDSIAHTRRLSLGGQREGHL